MRTEQSKLETNKLIKFALDRINLYTFATDGTRNGLIDYNSDGIITQRQETIIDENGNRISLFCNGDGTLREYYVPLYDDAGKEIGWTEYDTNGAILGTSTY